MRKIAPKAKSSYNPINSIFLCSLIVKVVFLELKDHIFINCNKYFISIKHLNHMSFIIKNLPEKKKFFKII